MSIDKTEVNKRSLRPSHFHSRLCRWLSGKESACQAGDVGSIPGLGRSLSSLLAWEIPWTEESGGLQPMGLQKVRHNLVTEQQRKLWKQVESMT